MKLNIKAPASAGALIGFRRESACPVSDDGDSGLRINSFGQRSITIHRRTVPHLSGSEYNPQ